MCDDLWDLSAGVHDTGACLVLTANSRSREGTGHMSRGVHLMSDSCVPGTIQICKVWNLVFVQAAWDVRHLSWRNIRGGRANSN